MCATKSIKSCTCVKRFSTYLKKTNGGRIFKIIKDKEVKLFFFSVQDCLSPLSLQALPAASESLCIVEMGGTEANAETGKPYFVSKTE